MITPEIVCLCGSTRYMADIEFVAQRETLAGCIVVRPEVNMRRLDARWQVTDTGETKSRLDELHRAKIRLAARVIVVAPSGYMGTSTRAELAYALELGKAVDIETRPSIISRLSSSPAAPEQEDR